MTLSFARERVGVEAKLRLLVTEGACGFVEFAPVSWLGELPAGPSRPGKPGQWQRPSRPEPWASALQLRGSAGFAPASLPLTMSGLREPDGLAKS
jgi:hypothetical protein